MFSLPDSLQNPPTFDTPLGPTWVCDAHSLGVDRLEGQFLVRSMPCEPSFLLISAVLKHASNATNIQQYPPSFWRREDEAVWIATPKPPGTLLSTINPPELAWAQTLKLWRPLADSVAAAHKRGVVVGNLTPFHLFFDAGLQQFSAVDAGTWISDPAVGDLARWWPPELRVGPETGRKPSFAADVFGLARLLIALSTNIENALQETPSFEGIPAYAIDGLLMGVDPSAANRPQRVSDLLAFTTPPPLRGKKSELGTGFDALYGRAQGVDKTAHEKNGQGVLFYMHYPEYEDDGSYAGEERVGAFFYEKRGREVYESIKYVWDGAQVNLLDAQEIFNSAGERYLTAQEYTLPVLEPYWPVSVTDVLKAEGCASRYYVDVRDSGAPGRPLVFGKILHGMLDDVSRSDVGFEECYAVHVANGRVDMIAAGLTDEDLPAFESDARHHFIKIAGFARGREIADGSRAGWTGENVEVTRYSTLFGLEGRIDLVTEDPKVGLQIIELKSGSERDEHVSQLRCYRLLWDGVAERRKLPIVGYLLYSKTGLLRSAPLEDPERERRILRARNELVASHRGQFDQRLNYHLPYFMEVPKACRDNACRFRKDRCAMQTSLCGLDVTQTADDAALGEGPWRGFEPKMINRAWKHYGHFSRLLELEFWEQTQKIGHVLQPERIWDRIASLEAIDNASLTSFDATTQRIVFEGEFTRRFVSGDSVLAHVGDFEREHILRGRVESSEPGRLEIWSQGAPNATTLPTTGWIIDSLPSRIGFRPAHRAMYRFLDRRDPRLFSIIFTPNSKDAKRASRSKVETEIKNHGFELNEKQREAVNLALTAPGAAIIQGPPGTGKTTVIAHIVAELLRDGQRILLSAQTNTAVDKMLESLVEIGVTDFVRVGEVTRSPLLARTMRERGIDPAPFFTRDIGRSTASLDALAKRLKYCPIVGCTTHASVGDSFFDFLRHNVSNVPFDVAIIDEATQITEPMTLGPIGLATRFVLVGDHKQLPPIVNNEQATSASISGSIVTHITEEVERSTPQLALFETDPVPVELTENQATLIGLRGLDQSLFERLVHEGLPYVMLEDQYRMHQDVMRFSSGWFYDGKLTAHASVATAKLEVDQQVVSTFAEPIQQMLDPNRAVVFFDVDGVDEGRQNEEEANAVVSAIEATLDAAEGTPSIGVVSPFRAQCHLIRRLLYKQLGERSEGIDVDTVERYQGSERDVIIVSWVKTRRPSDFLVDERRLNVTLTRARKKLVLFGRQGCLMLHPMYRDLIEQPQTHVGVWK